MTNEEAIQYLTDVCLGCEDYEKATQECLGAELCFEARRTAIKALSQQTEDAISRNNAITSICQWGTTLERIGKYQVTVAEMKQNCADMLRNLPSITPKQRTGHWIEVTNGRGGHECDLCHEYAPSYQDGDEWLTKYCPNCGAKMEVEG